MRNQIFIILFISFFALALCIQHPSVQHFDEQVVLLVEEWRTPLLTTWMIFFTYVGSIKVMGPITMLLAFIFLLNRKLIEIVFLFMTFFSVRLVNTFLKLLFERERPSFDRVMESGGFSFPSGHAMNSIAVFGFILILLLQITKNKIVKVLITFMVVILVLFIGLSRVYVGVHYPTDILAGFFAGGSWLLILVAFYNKVRQNL
ncbi:phosphatase PAP2 family protein [Bacillus kexueae]|uniref:phosphatase PAP2 family protein n=1 Tax=Aeribacillus kexueae TaxID=2078952 RepID=UPI001FAF1298|nr:phosphatase PAP2 family protein [Bacillus kexueae]